MKSGFENIYRCVYLGAVQGAVAWSAYAVAEFTSSSLLFRLARPYATFTSWHWRQSGLLIAAYLVAGVLAGALAGLAVYFLAKTRFFRNADAAVVLEAAATLTVVLAFAVNVLAAPFEMLGKHALLGVSGGLCVLLLASMRSAKWSERFGYLTHPWVVVGLLLGVGQEIGLLVMQNLAEQLGARIWLLSAGLVGSLIAVAVAAVLLGRWLRRRLARDRFAWFAPSWAALGLAVALMLGSAWLARESLVKAQASLSIPGHSAQPNVVVIIMDTVRADHLSIYGYERDTTPNLKKLARDSVLYTQAMAPSDMTLTSHASLFTGVYASWHGAYCQPPEASYGRELAPQLPTLAGILTSKGYAALGVAANLYLRPDFGLQRGFQAFHIPRPVPILGADESWYLMRFGMRRTLRFLVDTSQFDRLYSMGQDINKEFFAVLNKQELAHFPFFVFINYMDAHFPYIPPPPFDRLFPGKNDRVIKENLEETHERVVHGQPMPARDRLHVLSQYDGGIAYIDAQIGELVEWLKQQKLYDNTLIVISSDHGEAFGEKNLILHGNSAYQNLLHVGLLVKFPNSAHIGVVKDPVSLIDVAPTILSALGYSVPPGMQGRNLLETPAPPSRPIFGESFPCPVPQSPKCPSGCMARAVFFWPYKFINSSNGTSELYDLSSDPSETRDLSAVQSPAAQELRVELSRWVKTMPAQPRRQLKLEGEALQRLKSLGYVQ